MSFKRITLVGGGRWATILLKEIIKVFPNLSVDWACGSQINKKKKILSSDMAFKNISLVKKNLIYKTHKNNKVIIASHSSQHHEDFLALQDDEVDMLIEKPLFSSIDNFEIFAQEGPKNTFLNLEFYYAFFVRDFFEEVESIPLKKIEFVWHDPLFENRFLGKTKYSEIFSSIFMDQLLHVMSICKVFNLNPDKYQNLSVNDGNFFNKDAIELNFSCDNVDISVSLSRFAKVRARKIVINEDEATLNFTNTPELHINKKFKKGFNISDRLFPVASTLKNFINYPDSRAIEDLSIRGLLPFIKFCFFCEDEFIKCYSNSFSKIANEMRSCKKFDPCSAYYAGIMYYRQLIDSSDSSDIHFYKGNKGLSKLEDWWLIFLKQNVP